ncbi:MAG TPA: hypothetical protein VGB24_04005 [Longimicrobium sp.]|uniref:hypothetical protein n=1 Tax=Longimicrobium sp. TaxID=2029185 RepID=UPI002ED89918
MRLSLLALVLVLPLAGALSACEGNSFFGEPRLRTDTVSLAAPTSATTFATAIDLVPGVPGSPLESFPETPADADRFDFTVRKVGAQLVLRPFVPLGGGSGAEIGLSTRDFDALRTAPRGGADYGEEAVPLVLNTTYIMRSRPWGNGLQRCQTYAKAKVTALDAAAQTVRLAVVLNENCDDERLAD